MNMNMNMKQDNPVSRIKMLISVVLLGGWILLLLGLVLVARLLGDRQANAVIMWFHQGVARLFNLQVVRHGSPTRQQPALFVSNHISYLDIFVLGAVLPASFIAKSEVAGWPGFGKLAVLQNTLFFERNARRARQQIAQMQAHLQTRGNLILFPEGTSTPGTHVEPFKSSLFAAADGDTMIAPVTIAYTHYQHRPMNQAQRDFSAWYIPMPFLSHFLNGLGRGPTGVSLVFHEPVRLAQFDSRKACAAWCETQVRQGLLTALDVTDEVLPEKYLAAVGRSR